MTFNFRERIPFDFKTFENPMFIEIAFFSDDGPLTKKPYRFKVNMDSWDNIKMVKEK